MISIIIPAKNEEKYLPKLLSQLKKSSNIEIMVAVADSHDKTKQIAKKYGAKVVVGGLPGIGRNNGAKIATGKILIFLDADITLSNNFIKKAVKEFNKRELDCASVDITTKSGNIFDELIYFLNNLVQRISQYTFFKYGCGMCIIVKKDIFEKLKGFDKNITYAEDADFTKRAGKICNYAILNSCYIIASNRRFVKDGRIKTISRFIATAFKNIFGIKITKKNYYFKN